MDYAKLLIDLRKIFRSINLENKKVEKKYGVSTPQILVLNFLNEQESFQSTSKEIKGLLNLNASTVTGIISRLEKKGFVARIPSKTDRRVVKITLTMVGIDLIKSLPRVLHEKLEDKLESLNDAQVEEIQKSINILVNLLNAEDVEASPVLTIKENLLD